MLHFLIIRFKVNMLLAKTVRWNAFHREIRLHYWLELHFTNPIVQKSTFQVSAYLAASALQVQCSRPLCVCLRAAGD